MFSFLIWELNGIVIIPFIPSFYSIMDQWLVSFPPFCISLFFKDVKWEAVAIFSPEAHGGPQQGCLPNILVLNIQVIFILRNIQPGILPQLLCYLICCLSELSQIEREIKRGREEKGVNMCLGNLTELQKNLIKSKRFMAQLDNNISFHICCRCSFLYSFQVFTDESWYRFTVVLKVLSFQSSIFRCL